MFVTFRLMIGCACVTRRRCIPPIHLPCTRVSTGYDCVVSPHYIDRRDGSCDVLGGGFAATLEQPHGICRYIVQLAAGSLLPRIPPHRNSPCAACAVIAALYLWRQRRIHKYDRQHFVPLVADKDYTVVGKVVSPPLECTRLTRCPCRCVSLTSPCSIGQYLQRLTLWWRRCVTASCAETAGR